MAGVNASLDVTGKSTQNTSGTISSGSDVITIGSSTFPAIGVSLSPGAAADQAQQHWAGEVSVLAGGNTDLDLTALANGPGGANVNLARLLVFLADVEAPDGTILLQVGPQSVVNGNLLWFDAATDYDILKQTLLQTNTKGATPGWVVDATHKVIRFHNPGITTVKARVLLIGV